MAGAADPPYGTDLAYVHDTGFGDIAWGAARELLKRLAERGPDGGLVVDLGCAAGRLVSPVVDAGYDGLGIDISPAFVGMARQAEPRARFEVGSVHEADLPPCVAVTAIGEVLGYLPAPDPNAIPFETTLQRVADALPAGGLFLFDLILAGEAPSLTRRGWRAGDDWAVLSDVTEDPSGGYLTREIVTFRDTGDGSYRRRDEVHYARLFDPAGIEASLDALGFAVERASTYDGVALPPRRAAFICRRL